MVNKLEDLIVCSECDAIYRLKKPVKGEVATCARCHTVLAAPRRKAGLQIVALAITNLILMVGAATFPFLRIEAGGLGNSVSVLDAAFIFSSGLLVFLVIATIAMILAIPALRAVLVIYVIAPLMLDRAPWPGARGAFRLAQSLKPWAMAEVFAIGCAVSLIKITDLARVDFGPAFWMFAALVVLVVVQQKFMCNWSVWNALDTRNR